MTPLAVRKNTIETLRLNHHSMNFVCILAAATAGFSQINGGRTLRIHNVCRDKCADGGNGPMNIQCNASNEYGHVFANGYINVFESTTVSMEPTTASTEQTTAEIEKPFPSWIILALTLPLVGTLLIISVLITVLYYQFRRHRRPPTKQMRTLPSTEVPMAVRERTSDTYDDINDLPIDTTTAQSIQQTVENCFDNERPYQGIRDSLSSPLGYDSLHRPTYDKLDSRQHTNDAEQTVLSQPYLALLVDEDTVEYVTSQTYYEEEYPSGAQAAIPTNMNNKLDVNAVEYLVPAASAKYTTIQPISDNSEN